MVCECICTRTFNPLTITSLASNIIYKKKKKKKKTRMLCCKISITKELRTLKENYQLLGRLPMKVVYCCLHRQLCDDQGLELLDGFCKSVPNLRKFRQIHKNRFFQSYNLSFYFITNSLIYFMIYIEKEKTPKSQYSPTLSFFFVESVLFKFQKFNWSYNLGNFT